MPSDTDTASSAPPASRAPTFTPAAVRARHDGWTAERQRAFVEVLADTGCVSEAARRVGMSAESAYRLRRHPLAESFARAWEAALAIGVERLRDIAFERATNGVATPVFYKGEQVGERRTYNDRLLMFLLRHNDPVRYSELAFMPGFVAIDRTGEPARELARALSSLPAPESSPRAPAAHDEQRAMHDKPSARPSNRRERLRESLASPLNDNDSSRSRPSRP